MGRGPQILSIDAQNGGGIGHRGMAMAALRAVTVGLGGG